MADWRSFVLSDQSSVKDAINTLNQTSAQIVLCIDKDMKFVGLVVDGDIRRGLINGVGLEDPITMVMNRFQYVLHKQQKMNGLFLNVQLLIVMF